MSWPALGDLLARATREAFGEAVLWTGLGQSPTTIRATFSLAYEEVLPDVGVAVTSVRPNLDVRLVDLPAPPREGDRFTARAKSYAVEVVQLDGNGGARLLAREVEA